MSDQLTASEQFVEQAARAMQARISLSGPPAPWDQLDDEARRLWLEDTRTVLAVVEPLIRAQVAEQIAQAIEAKAEQVAADAYAEVEPAGVAWANIFAQAARIVRQCGKEE